MSADTIRERMARGVRAQGALDEFLAPMFASLREEYTARINEVATTELHPTIRADKITTLSVALKVLAMLESGMTETIRDGDIARTEKVRAEKIEQMTDAQQRLLKIGAGY